MTCKSFSSKLLHKTRSVSTTGISLTVRPRLQRPPLSTASISKVCHFLLGLQSINQPVTDPRVIDDEITMLTDLDAAMEPEVSPSDPDVSMTLNAFQMPVTSVQAPRQYATPEYMMPPPSFCTPKNLACYGATPGSVNTMMPDTVGFDRYDGPFQLSHISLFAESLDDHDENVDKRPKRARRHSAAPLEGLALSPINEDNEQPDLEPITGVDKTLWRENWEQSGRPGTLEDYARKQKAAMLSSDITSGIR